MPRPGDGKNFHSKPNYESMNTKNTTPTADSGSLPDSPSYASFEVSAVAYDGPDTIVATDDDDPAVFGFGLYGRDGDGLARWISDHPTRADAESAMSALYHNAKLSHEECEINT